MSGRSTGGGLRERRGSLTDHEPAAHAQARVVRALPVDHEALAWWENEGGALLANVTQTWLTADAGSAAMRASERG